MADDALPDAPGVLVVEPYAALQQLLVSVLQAEGLSTRLVSPAQALGLLTQQPAPLLILDLETPDPVGDAQAQALVALAQRQGTPVLVLTGWVSTVAELQARVGADAYLQKPFRVVALRHTVHALLATPTSIG